MFHFVYDESRVRVRHPTCVNANQYCLQAIYILAASGHTPGPRPGRIGWQRASGGQVLAHGAPLDTT